MPYQEPLTEHSRVLLEILQRHGDWITRKDIARDLSSGRLSPRSVGALNYLVAQGRLEIRLSPAKIGRRVFQYRAKPPAANGV